MNGRVTDLSRIHALACRVGRARHGYSLSTARPRVGDLASARPWLLLRSGRVLPDQYRRVQKRRRSGGLGLGAEYASPAVRGRSLALLANQRGDIRSLRHRFQPTRLGIEALDG